MTTKHKLHPRNKHNENYDFDRLCRVSPSLKQYLVANKVGQPSINFADSLAVRALNGALLNADYNIQGWSIPNGYLCPPIPGRVDYIHYIADLLGEQKRRITGLDIGTGASCIYPLMGQRVYRWQFIATDIDPESIRSSQRIIETNKLSAAINLRLQPDRRHVFKDIIYPSDRIDFTLCNPPFHESQAQADQSSARKRRNLGTNKRGHSKRNFGGQKSELWCTGGERAFVSTMIEESVQFATQVLWFTSLVSKRENLRPLKRALRAAGAVEVQVVGMAQGQKVSRFIAWTFFTPQQRADW